MVRRIAVDALEKIARTSCMAQEALAPILGRVEFSAEDQAFLWELVHGVVRHRVTLDRILATFSRVRLGKIHRRVLQVLRTAVYQVIWLDRIPDRAAVYESVEIVKTTFPAWTVSFTNGVLRSITRAVDVKVAGALSGEDLRRAVPISGYRHCLLNVPVFPDPGEGLAESLALRHGYPEWLVARWLGIHGEETTEGILRAGNEPATLWLRPVPGRFDDVTRELGKRKIPFETADDPPAVRLLAPVGQIQELPGFKGGWFVVQDRSAMRPAALLDPPPGGRVLDLCSAPGGKCTQLAGLVGPEGSVVAVDRDERRLRRISESIDRLGLGNVALVTADLTEEGLDLGGPFDHVLLDAPCSNTGVLGKRAEVRHRVNPAAVETIGELQRELLRRAVAQVAPGGALVYSTCALLPVENQDVVRRLIEEGLPFRLEKEIESLPRGGYSDGGYAALLRHVGES